MTNPGLPTLAYLATPAGQNPALDYTTVFEYSLNGLTPLLQ